MIQSVVSLSTPLNFESLNSVPTGWEGWEGRIPPPSAATSRAVMTLLISASLLPMWRVEVICEDEVVEFAELLWRQHHCSKLPIKQVHWHHPAPFFGCEAMFKPQVWNMPSPSIQAIHWPFRIWWSILLNPMSIPIWLVLWNIFPVYWEYSSQLTRGWNHQPAIFFDSKSH